MQPSLTRYAAVKITDKPGLHHHKDFMASVYTPVQNFQYHLNKQTNKMQKEVKFCLDCYASIMYLAKPCMIIPAQFDMIHHVSTNDHIWKILIHNSSKKVIDQVNTVCKEYQKSLNQSQQYILIHFKHSKLISKHFINYINNILLHSQ